MKNALMKWLWCACMIVCTSQVVASPWTSWIEYPSNPVYAPYGTEQLDEDYWPCVLYSKHQFDHNGDPVFYKMWHQGDDGIALSYSDDGINWVLKGGTSITGNAYHPCVVYDRDGFGNSGYTYMMWFWTGDVGTDTSVIQYACSSDGLNWTDPQPISQDPDSPLCDGTVGSYFYHSYGPGCVLYNPYASYIDGQPFTFPFVMFFDTASEGFVDGDNSQEQIGLACSMDGINWSNCCDFPVLIPPGDGSWDQTHAFRPAVVQVHGIYHMFYSGSNGDPTQGIPYAHGIGHATSPDGINWTPDADNPVFICTTGPDWRNSRTFTPTVVVDKVRGTGNEQARMWFVGGSGDTPGANQAIGYATMALPPIVMKKK
jgi:hypothetical protein